jgi:hypothetical protein
MAHDWRALLAQMQHGLFAALLKAPLTRILTPGI